MTRIPPGTKNLIITIPNQEKRFAAIKGIIPRLLEYPGLHHLTWKNTNLPLFLQLRRSLSWVLINGHGPENAALISDGANVALKAGQLILPRQTKLYLLGCYQGKEALRRIWAQKSRIPLSQVYGSPGETESALSTLLFLNLHRFGPCMAGHLFARWRQANEFYRSSFPVIRQAYQEAGFQFQQAFGELQSKIDMAPFKDFFQVAAEEQYRE